MLRLSTSAFALLTATASLGAAQAEVIGTLKQPIIVGGPVGLQEQKELGLVTVSGGCSGTLINSYWVLTADHCVAVGGVMGGADLPFAQTPITAAWSPKTITPTRFVRFFNSHGLDVALVFLGSGDFGKMDRKLIYHGDLDDGMTLTKFGQGICAYASGSGPTATPAQSNCGYRFAQFTPGQVTQSLIDLPTNNQGQVGNGGDSGGPDYVSGQDNWAISIASVQSTCTRTGSVAGQPANWTWTTSISSCQSARLIAIRDDIHRIMSELPPDADRVSMKESGPLAGAVFKPSKEVIASDRSMPLPKAQPKFGQIAASIPNAGAAMTLARDFTAEWKTVTLDNTEYWMSLKQSGAEVQGVYGRPGRAPVGTLSGVVSGDALAFRWTEGASSGSGKFKLAADSASFTGWWNYSADNPDAVESAWTGTRK